MALVLGMTVGSCGSSGGSSTGGNDPKTVTYKGIDLAGNEYSLTIPNTARAARSNSHGNFNMKIKSGGKEAVSSGTITDIADDGTHTLLTPDDSEFTVTINDDEISSIVGEIPLEDGSTFIVRTFDAVYLRADRYTYTDPRGGGANRRGEIYHSGNSIRLKDIYIGNLNDLIKKQFGTFKVKISGRVDIKLNEAQFNLQYRYPANDNSGRIDQVGVGGGIEDLSNWHPISFGPGDFSVDVELFRNEVDIDTLPTGGEIIVELVEVIMSYSDDPDEQAKHGVDGSIPDNIPNGTIMATIRNLKITPVD